MFEETQKIWRTIAQDHLKKIKEILSSWEQNIQKYKTKLKTFAQYCSFHIWTQEI